MGCVFSTSLPKEPPAIPRVSSTVLPLEPPGVPPGGEEDLISALPDELLHIILSRLLSAAAAARTSVLSRRWRGVWAHMPELVLGGRLAPATTPSALLDSINSALSSFAAPTLRSLNIEVSGFDGGYLPARRISPWLRFASQRVAGKLRIHLYPRKFRNYIWSMEELALPICGRATEIDLLYMETCTVSLPPTGSFSLLTDLHISCTQMDGADLGRVVSSLQCPRLRKLHFNVGRLEPVRDISISSESLQCLRHRAPNAGKLEVTASMLQEISVDSAAEACIVAPKLEKVVWLDNYDPGRHQFLVAGSHLRSLSVRHSVTRLMERFDTTSELTIYLGLLQGIAGYTTFLKETEKLPMCETLVVELVTNHHAHAFAPILRACSSIRKFKLILSYFTSSQVPSCTTSNCPCHLPKNYRFDDITFNSLEEIEISCFRGSAEQVECVKLLLSSNMVALKKVDFTVTVSSEIMEVVQRIHSICYPSSKVQFKVNGREVPKP